MTYRIEAIPMTLSHLQGHSYCKPFNMIFTRATLWYSAVFAIVACPSVRSRSCTITAKQITQPPFNNSPGTVVLWCKRSLRNSYGITLQRVRQMQVE